jgi:hypothetical protein
VSKYLRKSTYKEEVFILIDDFRGFSSWSLGLVAFGSMAKQQIMAGLCGEGNSSSPHGSQEAK